VGRILARTYRIEKLLATGGMGEVYQVSHVRTGGLLAVKVLHREVASNPEVYRRFQEEARTTSGLRHPHIVQVTDFDQDDDGTPFLVMEMLDGEDLYERLNREGRLSVPQVLELGRQVGSALHAAHKSGIVHRDVKPQNIFLVRHQVGDDWVEVAKVVDFGLSKIQQGERQTGEHLVAGTPYYMSPEVLQGPSAALDGRADQFSLAVVLYRALSGRLPFDGDDVMDVLLQVLRKQPPPLRELAPEVPQHVIEAIERAMSKDRAARFPTMTAFVRALLGAQAGWSSSPGVSGSMYVGNIVTAEVRGNSGQLAPAGPGGPGQAQALYMSSLNGSLSVSMNTPMNSSMNAPLSSSSNPSWHSSVTGMNGQRMPALSRGRRALLAGIGGAAVGGLLLGVLVIPAHLPQRKGGEAPPARVSAAPGPSWAPSAVDPAQAKPAQGVPAVPRQGGVASPEKGPAPPGPEEEPRVKKRGKRDEGKGVRSKSKRRRRPRLDPVL
jgi:serine/threonine protein kinase